VNAAVEYTLKQSECKIIVDGVEVKGELPLLMMEPGFNYIPAAEIRSICDKIGVGFEFDALTKEVRIDTTKTQALATEPSPVPTPIYAQEVADGKEVLSPQTLLQIFPIDILGGEEYIRLRYIQKVSQPDGYDFFKSTGWVMVSVTSDFDFNSGLSGENQGKYTVLLENIPITIIHGCESVTVDYYTNTILPLIK
jgi:hypothetical protein